MLLGKETCGRLTLDDHRLPNCSCYRGGLRPWEEGAGAGDRELEAGRAHARLPSRPLPVCPAGPGTGGQVMTSKLDQFPRVGWSNKLAWSLLQLAKPFVLSAKDGICFVQSGGSATRVDDDGLPIGGTIAAAKLQEPSCGFIPSILTRLDHITEAGSENPDFSLKIHLVAQD